MFSLSKCIKSFQFAVNGIWIFFRNENNAKFHLFASIIVVSLGFFFEIPLNSWLWISLAIAIVWISEAINTAIEKLVDFISPEFNPKAGEIKDLAAGAVLFASFFALVIGIIIFKDSFLKFIMDVF